VVKKLNAHVSAIFLLPLLEKYLNLLLFIWRINVHNILFAELPWQQISNDFPDEKSKTIFHPIGGSQGAHSSKSTEMTDFLKPELEIWRKHAQLIIRTQFPIQLGGLWALLLPVLRWER